MKRGTIGHPKMTALMKALNISRYQAVGIVESLIHFTGSFARLGDIGRWSDEQIAEGIDWPSKRAAELVNALTGSGWLDRHPDPTIRLSVHDWADHADDAVKKWVERAGKAFVSRHVEKCRDMSGNVTPARALCQSPLPEPDNTACAEVKKPTSPPSGSSPVLVFPCVGTGVKEWPLAQEKIDEYKTSFPGVDVLAECRAARQWEIDNPTKRKTFGGHPAFLTNWLKRTQDRGGGMEATKTAKPPQKLPEVAESMATMQERDRQREVERKRNIQAWKKEPPQ